MGISKINLLLPLHLENNGDIVLFIPNSPVVRAKDLLLVRHRLEYWCFVRCPF